MIAVVQQPLGHIECGDMAGVVVVATILGAESVEDKFVFAQSLDGQVVVLLEAFLDIIGIEHRELAGHGDVLPAHAEQVAIGADNDAEVAEESGYGSERGVGVLQVVSSVLVAPHAGIGQEFLQSLSHPYGTASRTATAVGCREGLVEVDVHHVKSHVAGAAHAQHGVEVGAVVVHQSAAFVYEGCYFGDLCLEDAQRVGVGHHHAGDVVAQYFAERCKVDRSLRCALDLDDLESADGGAGGVGAVGRVGHDNLDALMVAAREVVAADDHEPRQFAVGTGVGIEGKLAKSGYLA